MAGQRANRTSGGSRASVRDATGPWSNKSRLLLIVGSDNGAFIVRSDSARNRFRTEGPYLPGRVILSGRLDPRDGTTMLLAAGSSRAEPTNVHVSRDLGRSWTAARTAPGFSEKESAASGRTVKQVVRLSPGHSSETNTWYAGTVSQGLFRSEDGGLHWQRLRGFDPRPERTGAAAHTGGDADRARPYSILIDPRDARRIYVGSSSCGVLVSEDRGESFHSINNGRATFVNTNDADSGEAPHRILMNAAQPDRLWLQSPDGIYRMDRPKEDWLRVGARLPVDVGDRGFPMTLHPRDGDTAWVLPVDGSASWPGVSPNGRPSIYVTRDAGHRWRRLDRGLPRAQAWFGVTSEAFVADAFAPAGIYFGTTSGEVWASRNEGASFHVIAQHLPAIRFLYAAAG